MGQLILLRHGQSAWNEKNLFCGWVDVPLSQEGVQEALAAGDKLAQAPVDAIYTSTLVRAQMTLCLALLRHSSGKVPCFVHSQDERMKAWSQVHSTSARKELIPVHTAWELNERMYGELQGLNKAEVTQQYGADQVQEWRRSFFTAPPGGESLEKTAERAWPYFQKVIRPRLDQGQNIWIVAHGNSLRAVVMHLEHLTPEEIVRRELATGDPLIYGWPLS